MAATIPCAANPRHGATERVLIESDSAPTHMLLCRPCRIEMQVAAAGRQGVTVRVVARVSALPDLERVSEPRPISPPRKRGPVKRVPKCPACVQLRRIVGEQKERADLSDASANEAEAKLLAIAGLARRWGAESERIEADDERGTTSPLSGARWARADLLTDLSIEILTTIGELP